MNADIDGYAEPTRALDIPIATGENLYTVADFARFLRRAGGPTALLQIGAITAAFHRPYASHGGGPVQLNTMACLSNALYLETGLLTPDSPLRLEEGSAQIPQGPGFGWT